MSLADRVYIGLGKNNNDCGVEEKKNFKKFKPQKAFFDIQAPYISDDELALNFPAQFIYGYLNRQVINNALKINPNIKKILKENGLKETYYLANVNSVIMSHLIPTARKAKEIYLNSGHKKNEAGCLYLIEAALLHDMGKIFMPPEILNKTSKLTLKERNIINLHNRLGYEILITTRLNPRVAQLVLEHHDYDKKVKQNDENQILILADIYSALKENRPYRKAVDNYRAAVILYDMALKGAFDMKYLSYLTF